MITEAGELLLRRGLITAEQLVQSRANLNGNGILESIIESGFAREEDGAQSDRGRVWPRLHRSSRNKR